MPLILCLLNLLMFLNVYCTIIYLIYSIVTLINIIDFIGMCLIFFFWCMHMGYFQALIKAFILPFLRE